MGEYFKENMKILDYGCGPGQFCNFMSSKLKNFEYDLKMAQKNSEKWKTMIKFCDKKGWEFIIITEDHLKKMGLL
jgi:G:T-mismatch repair DNA endonuclease (very short patch repair protein)